VAIWNGFWGPSFGAEADAAGFHFSAVKYARGQDSNNFAISNIYIYVLGTIYRWTFESMFWGSYLSCNAWLVSAVVITRIMNLLKINETNQFKAVLLYALMPSVVLLTSVTLREAYQLLAVNIVVYAALKIYINESNKKNLLILLIGVICLGALHGALLIAGLYIVALTCGITIYKNQGQDIKIKLFLWLLLLLLLSYAGSSLYLDMIFNSNMALGDAIQARQESWQQSARASYPNDVRINTNFDLLLFVPVALFHYLFQPMIWRATTLQDWGLLMENFLRCILIFKAVNALSSLPHRWNIPLIIVFSTYLLIEVVWAIGTINWGTAARHHIPAFGLLIIASFAGEQKNE
jgi:hypothetical protein